MSDFNLRAIISVVDRLTPALRAQVRTLRGWRRQMQTAGAGGVQMAAGLGAALVIPAKAFMESEQASIQLKNTLMTKDGLSNGFKELSDIAVDLGNKLPGTTADFMAMASTLKSLGLDTDALIGGALKASAYLAVVGKPLGVTYEQAATSIGKLSNAFGIASKDLEPFADSLQRTLHMGVDLEQFTYAMSRASGPLKAVKMQGLGVANATIPLVALLIRAGVSGEEAGTGIKKMMSSAISAGKFTGVERLVADLEKLDKLSPAARMGKLEELFGEMHAAKASIISAGGYKELVKEMDNQASMTMRVTESLKTMTNLWDAATGTFTNAMVAFATAYGPEMKALTMNINELSASLQTWSTKHGPMIRTVLKIALSLTALRLGFLAVGVGLNILIGLFAMSPFGLFMTALAILVPFVYDNWGAITGFIKDAFSSAIDWVSAKWDNLKSGFMLGIKAFSMAFNGLKSMFVGGSPMLFESVAASSNVISLDNARKNTQSNSLIQSRTKSAIDVNFNNTPQGVRVVPYKTKGIDVNANVGYRSLGAR